MELQDRDLEQISAGMETLTRSKVAPAVAVPQTTSQPRSAASDCSATGSASARSSSCSAGVQAASGC